MQIPGRRFLAMLGLVGTTALPAVATEDHIVRLDPALDTVLSGQTEIRTLATGFTWAEGPAWDSVGKRLLFSDVPENKAYAWSAADGLSVFLDPSGHQGPDHAGFREAGSNGLLFAPDGKLLIANHGSRAIEAYSVKDASRRTLANRFRGKHLNSPNDLVLAPDGTLYFTDPPYGLEGLDASPMKEQPHNGVYAVAPGGTVTLVDDSLTRPNGVALSANGAHLYVAVSDPDRPIIYRYRKTAKGFTNREIFFDASPYLAKGWPGLPDGMAVAATGHVFATGPGGVFVLNENGALIGMIRLNRPTANCAFGADGNTLFITSADRVLAVETLVQGAYLP